MVSGKRAEMSPNNPDMNIDHIEDAKQIVSIPIDFDDPHRAALEDDPQEAEKLSWRLILAVIVSWSLYVPYVVALEAHLFKSLWGFLMCARSPAASS